MSNYQPIVKTFLGSEINLSQANEGVEEHIALNRRKALKSNTCIIINKEEGANSVQIGVLFSGIKGVMGYKEDAEANRFIADQNDDDIVNGAVMAEVIVKECFENAETAKSMDDEKARLNAEDTLLCLNEIADHPEVADARLSIAQRNIDEWSNKRKEVLKRDESKPCAILQGDINGSPEIDHIKLKSEFPEHALNKLNLRKVGENPHKARHIKRTQEGKEFVSNNNVENPNSLVGHSLD